MKLIIIFLLLTISSTALSCTLNGKWKSQKKTTLAELYGSRVSNSEKLRLARVYGKAIIEYSNCNTMTEILDGFITIYHFEIIEDKKTSVIVKDTDTGDQKIIYVYGNCFKSPVKGMAFYEHFCKI